MIFGGDANFLWTPASGLLDRNHIAVGNYSSLVSSILAPGDLTNNVTQGSYTAVEILNEFFSGDLSTKFAAGLRDWVGFQHTGASAATVYGIDSQPTINSNSTGPITLLSGIYSNISNYGTGVVTKAAAATLTAGATGGPITTLYGADITVYGNGAAAVTTTAAAVHVARGGAFSASTFTNLYGVLVDDQSGLANVANNLNVVSRGTNSQNLFEGTVTIGLTGGDLFANLPTAPVLGMIRRVSDATVNRGGAVVSAGGGANKILAWYNGTAWHVLAF